MTGSNRRPSACKADALPAELILQYVMTPTGLEPVLPPWKGGVLTAWPRGHMAPQVGLEPTTDRLTADSSTTELLWNNNIAWQRPTLAGCKSNYHRR